MIWAEKVDISACMWQQKRSMLDEEQKTASESFRRLRGDHTTNTGSSLVGGGHR